MDEHNCPTKEKNRAAHRKFLEQFNHLSAMFEEQGPTTTILVEMRQLIGKWLSNHICSVDKHLRQCNQTCLRKPALATNSR
jgi:hemerythrin